MYAVIAIGGKQARVEVGSKLDIELVDTELGGQVNFVPLLVVDDESVISDKAELSDHSVTATVTGESKGPKITGFTYQAKARRRRRYGHRQHYSTIEVTAISPTKTGAATAARSEG